MAWNKDINPDDRSKFKNWLDKQEEGRQKRRRDREELRKKWQTLETSQLRNTLESRLMDYNWYSEYHPQGMDGAQRVDIAGESKLGGHLVLVEVERGRAHAIDNVVKVWRYIEENVDSKPVLLIQVFSPYFYGKTGNKRRMKEAVFVGKQAEKATNKLKYEALGQEYWPQSEDSNLYTLVGRIASLLSVIRNE
jgi:hypothetical protein